MGRGDDNRQDAEPLGAIESTLAEDVLVNFQQIPQTQSYYISVRFNSEDYPMTVQSVDQSWSATDGYRFIHTPFLPTCACGESNCAAVQILRLLALSEFTMPRGKDVTPYQKYRRLAPGVTAALSGIRPEKPLFIIRLSEQMVVVHGANISKAVVVDGRCVLCASANCAHTEAATHADSEVAALEQLAPDKVENAAGMLLGASVVGYPKGAEALLGFVSVYVMDFTLRKEMTAQAEMGEQRAIRKMFMDALREEKEAAGETFDESEYKAEPDVEPDVPATRSSWDPLQDPDKGIALVINAHYREVLFQPLVSTEQCACGTEDCVHLDILARIKASDVGGFALDPTTAPAPEPARKAGPITV